MGAVKIHTFEPTVSSTVSSLLKFNYLKRDHLGSVCVTHISNHWLCVFVCVCVTGTRVCFVSPPAD